VVSRSAGATLAWPLTATRGRSTNQTGLAYRGSSAKTTHNVLTPRLSHASDRVPMSMHDRSFGQSRNSESNLHWNGPRPILARLLSEATGPCIRNNNVMVEKVFIKGTAKLSDDAKIRMSIANNNHRSPRGSTSFAQRINELVPAGFGLEQAMGSVCS